MNEKEAKNETELNYGTIVIWCDGLLAAAIITAAPSTTAEMVAFENAKNFEEFTQSKDMTSTIWSQITHYFSCSDRCNSRYDLVGLDDKT